MSTPSPLTRVISDLHYGHPAARVQRLEQIAPLLEGVDRVVFNGDSVEARFARERPRGEETFAHLQAFCAERCPAADFLTGNHDPLITPQHHLDLAGGAILVTHGDVLFHGLTPWSRETPLLRRAHTAALEELGHPTDLEGILAAARKTALAVESLGPRPHHHAKVVTLRGIWLQIWPPDRVLRMLDSWWRLPDLAAAFVRQHRPTASAILLGHTHRAGVWQRGKCCIVNTGSFLPWSGLLVVDCYDGEMKVRKVDIRNGNFRPGTVIARHPLQS